MASRLRDIYTDLRYWVGPGEWGAVLGPSAFFIAAIALLTYDHTSGGLRDREAIFWAALVLVVFVFAWMLVRIGEESRTAASQYLSSFRDELTGLGSASALRYDLESAFAARSTTVLFVIEMEAIDPAEESPDLAVKEARTVNAAAAMSAAAASLPATVYRTEGASFAMLTPVSGDDPADVSARARAVLGGGRQGALANAHFGEVVFPGEAERPEQALQVANDRLAASKRHGIRSARRQAHAALLAALAARHPELREQLRSAVPHVISVGRRLGLDSRSLDDAVLAAGLRDVGMLALPDSTLDRDAAVTADARAQFVRHPIDGERIVAAAPSLAPVAPLVRAAHENYDGSGYPDGLIGPAIPLAARVVSACVDAAALSSDPSGHGADVAVAELAAGSGSRYDPRVVSVLVEELTEEAGAGRPSPARAPRDPAARV